MTQRQLVYARDTLTFTEHHKLTFTNATTLIFTHALTRDALTLTRWVWLSLVLGIIVSAVPLAYVLTVDTLPCSGVSMPDSWQHTFFDVPAGCVE